jgi:DNA-binding PadR family transcriptional regulator
MVSIVRRLLVMFENADKIALTEAVYYILLSLYTPLHGYGIMQNILKISNGRVNLAAGTLYGALTTLQEKKWIKAIEDYESSRKKIYEITDLGRFVVETEIKRLEELVDNGHKIVGRWS